DDKDCGPARSVQPERTYRTSNRSLPGESAKGWKWVVRDPDARRVLREVLADRPQQSITVSKGKRKDVPADNASAPTPEEKGQRAAGGSNRAELLRLIDQHRQANGQGPLSVDPSLTWAAQDHVISERKVY